MVNYIESCLTLIPYFLGSALILLTVDKYYSKIILQAIIKLLKSLAT
jgi:hypothetical protein